jgi:hypothetical protein
MSNKAKAIATNYGIRWNTCWNPFNIFVDAKYHWVKVVSDEAILWSLTTSLGKTIKKSNVLSIQEKCKML